MGTSKRIDKKRSWGKSLLYLFFALLLLSLLMYITYRLSHQVYKQNQINKEISKLEEEISSLNQENKDLEKLLSYLQTDEFKEKEAKDKLNLIKEGERLVLIKENELKEVADDGVVEREADVVVYRPNYYWWWYYYFSLE